MARVRWELSGGDSPRLEGPGTSQLGSVGSLDLLEWGEAAGPGALGREGLFVLGGAAIPAEIMDVHRRWGWGWSPSGVVGTGFPGLGLLWGSQDPFSPLRIALPLPWLRCSGVHTWGFSLPQSPRIDSSAVTTPRGNDLKQLGLPSLGILSKSCSFE